MSKLSELYDKRNQLVGSTRAFLDAKRAVSETLSAEDETAYNKMESDIAALTKEIEREGKLSAIENDMRKPTSQPIVTVPHTQDNEPTGRASNEYKNAMLDALRSNFRKVSNVLETGTDSKGGFLVPAEWDKRLIDTLEEECVMRKLGTRITTSGEHKINLAATKPAASWIGEGTALTFGDATFEQITLDAHKLHVAVKVTEELLYDNAYNLEGYLLDQFGKALANAEEDAFLNGNGTEKPIGLFHATKGGQIGLTTAGNSPTADEIISLVYTLKRPYRKNAAFITNDQTLAVIRKLKDNNGAYLWQASLQAGEPDRLFGYPIYTSAYVPTIEAGAAALAFGDYSYYNIGDRGTRSFAELKELFAGNGMVAFLAKERVDGRLVLAEAVQIMKIKGSA